MPQTNFTTEWDRDAQVSFAFATLVLGCLLRFYTHSWHECRAVATPAQHKEGGYGLVFAA